MTKNMERAGFEAPPGLEIPHIEYDLTRREFLVGAGLAILAPGCGSGGESGEENTSVNARTIEHKYGSTEVSGRPERVVVVGLTEQDAVLALGAVPVGTTEWYGEHPGAIFPWATDELGDAEPPETVGTIAQTNFEAVAAMEPDLILGLYSGLTGDQYDTLSEIAPTIAQSEEYGDYGIPWQALTRTVGHALGRRDRAEELIAEVDARFAEVRGQYPQFEGKTAVVGEFFDTFFARSESDPRTRFLTSLGFVLPEEIANLEGENSDGANVSEERLSLFDRDLLLWNVGFYPQLEEELADNEIYQQLDVAREGRDIFLSDEVLSGALTFATVLSIPYALDNLAPLLAAAVDGDPQTEVEGAA